MRKKKDDKSLETPAKIEEVGVPELEGDKPTTTTDTSKQETNARITRNKIKRTDN